MERTRELYMDITVAGRNFERKDEILTLKPENTIEILDAYFAKRDVKAQFKTYIVAKNESLSKIATSNNTTNEIIKKDNNLTSNTIPVNQKLKIRDNGETGNEVTFTHLKVAEVGDEVYIVIKTKDAQGLTITTNIKQGKADGLVKVDEALSVLQNDNELRGLKATVGEYKEDKPISNRDDFNNWAIVKLTLKPEGKVKQKEWNDALQKLTNKKTNLYLLVDAHSDNGDCEVIYTGTNSSNKWLNMDTDWFELKKKIPIFVLDPGHGYTGRGVNVGAQARKYRYKLKNDQEEPKKNEKGDFITEDAWAGDLPNYVLNNQNKWITEVLNKYDSTKLEAHLTYDISIKLKELLENEGYIVHNTRTSREIIKVDNSQLDERTKIANDNKADYFISLHADGSVNFNDSGAHTIYPASNYSSYASSEEEVEESKILAKEILSKYTVISIESNSPKVDERLLYVLNGSHNNAQRKVLVELGFISNPSECVKMFNNISKIAEELFEGIKNNVNANFP